VRRVTIVIMRATITVALAAALLAAAPAQAKELVRYQVSGGIAGLSEQLVVRTGGSARQTSRREATRRFRLSAAQMRALRRDLRDAKFPSLSRHYGPSYPVADGIAQTVRYRGRSVTVETGGDPPEPLRKVLRRLSRIMR
jgi:hypothetical protein